MSQTNTVQPITHTAEVRPCPPLAVRITKSLLGYGVITGPFYVTVSLTEALTRDGFDPTRHAWSLLSNGGLGWIHIANLILSGLMVIAGAVGLRRALTPGRASAWAPRLLAVYGLGMVAAGCFRADPAAGFPAGTPADANAMSWHGMLHFTSGGVGFTCLIVASFVLASRFAADGHRGKAAFSRATGILFATGFLAMSASGGAAWTNLAFTAAIVLVSAWISVVSIHFYGRADRA